MLVAEADATARELLDTLFDADSTEAMESAFADLRAEIDWRISTAEEIDRKRRAEHGGGPRRVKRVEEGVMDAVLAEWDELTGGGTDYSADGEGSPGPDEGDV